MLRNQPPMEPDQIIDAAVRLTRQHGLEIWTIRQLASELDCWPAVIYHHVGGREDVAAAVVDHVIGMVKDVDETLHWRAGFQRLLGDLRLVLRQYQGVARWLTLNGGVPSMVRIAERGVAALAAAGFGAEAFAAYSVLVDGAVMMIALEDDRDARTEPDESEGYGPVWGLPIGHPGVVAGGGTGRSADDFYRYSVERMIDGVSARLAALHGGVVA